MEVNRRQQQQTKLVKVQQQTEISEGVLKMTTVHSESEFEDFKV